MNSRIQTKFLIGIVLAAVFSGCVADDAVEPTPAQADVDQYLNPPDGSEDTEADDIDRANREGLDEMRRKSGFKPPITNP